MQHLGCPDVRQSAAVRGCGARHTLQRAPHVRSRPPARCRTPPAAAPDPSQPSTSSSTDQQPGDDQLWFVKKFEARRRALEEEAARRAAAGSAGSEDGGSSGSGAAAAQQLEQAGASSATGDASAEGAAAEASVGGGEGAPAQLQPQQPRQLHAGAAARQGALLVVGLAGLILWPAALQPGGLYEPRVWLLLSAYLAFFAGGTLRRTLLYGRLAPAAEDRQRAGGGSKAALAAFICAMPLLHWAPLTRYLTKVAATPFDPVAAAAGGGPPLYDVLGGAMIAAAAALNWAAAGALGAAYDRVVAPQRLVTSGPYSLVQHPIYGSYMLLFAGYALACHSAPLAVLSLWVCRLYYRRRAALEAGLLAERFGQAYDDYRLRTPKQFVPWVA